MKTIVKERLNVHQSIRTFTGKYINVFEPDPELIDPVDIAHSLSQMCRFGGHTKTFHSVAEHSIWVAQRCSPKNALAGLLHDATEAYLIDMPKPIKVELHEYVELEKILMQAIATRFGIEFPLPKEVKKVDAVALKWEWENKVLNNTFKSMTPRQAERAFLREFKKLTQ